MLTRHLRRERFGSAFNLSLGDELSQARRLLREDEAKGAEFFDRLLNGYPEFQAKILRERSLGYAEKSKFLKAFEDRARIAAIGSPSIGDLYFAAEYAMQGGEFEQALLWFEECINASLNQGNSYYLNSARLLSAMCWYLLKDRDRALALLESVGDDVSVMWLEGFDPEITKRYVLRLLG